MTDREKIISAIEKAKKQSEEYALDRIIVPFKEADMIIAMLKKHETVKPKKIKGYNPPMYTLYEYKCEECESPIMNKQPFCMGCGRAVEWDDI